MVKIIPTIVVKNKNKFSLIEFLYLFSNFLIVLSFSLELTAKVFLLLTGVPEGAAVEMNVATVALV